MLFLLISEVNNKKIYDSVSVNLTAKILGLLNKLIELILFGQHFKIRKKSINSILYLSNLWKFSTPVSLLPVIVYMVTHVKRKLYPNFGNNYIYCNSLIFEYFF
ncbi:hypothetical protein AMJ80_06025 [bacterium SM23_31]|nr:MAG: hypothetical protein AMJ80_06025 [bacterium SM23_31]